MNIAKLPHSQADGRTTAEGDEELADFGLGNPDDIVRYYTREAGRAESGARDRQDLPQGGEELLLLQIRAAASCVSTRNLDKYLGVQRYRYGRAEENDQIGQVTGLAWTEVGGELLSIESAVVPGKGKLIHTGQLGDVMQESIQAAMTVVRSRADVLGIDSEFHQKCRRPRPRP